MANCNSKLQFAMKENRLTGKGKRRFFVRHPGMEYPEQERTADLDPDYSETVSPGQSRIPPNSTIFV